MKLVRSIKLLLKCAIMVSMLLLGVSLSVSVVKAETYEEKVGDNTWIVNVEEDGVVSITLKEISSVENSCVIPEKVHGYTVNCISEKAFANKDMKGYKKVVIPNTVTCIRKNAFLSCTNLKSVVIPNSVVKIEEGAFSNCEQLEYINLPKNLREIEEDAFSGCEKIEDVSIPTSVTSIGNRAFKNCGIEWIVLPSGLVDVKEDIFYGNKKIKDIYFMGTVEQWNENGYKRLVDVCFQYSGCSECQIKVHFYSPFLWKNPVSATYELNAKDVAPLSIGATADIEIGNNVVITPNLTYQWYVNQKDDNVNGTLIPGATQTDYLPPVDAIGTSYYYCVVTSKFGRIQTDFSSATAKIQVTDREYYDVSFVSNSSAAVPTQRVRSHSLVTKPEVVPEEGYLDVVWYQDEAFTKAYDFAQPVTKDLTLYGKWDLDYSVLQAAVNEARLALADTGYISRYTTESVQRYCEKIEIAQEMIDKKTAPSREAIVDMTVEVYDAKYLLIIKPEERPVPHIENGIAHVTLHGEELTIQDYTKGAAFNQKAILEYKEKNKMIQTKSTAQSAPSIKESGFYTFYVNDSYGDDFYLIVYYDSRLGVTSYFDLSELSYEIQKAQSLYDATPASKSGLGAGEAYTTQKAKDTLLEAINNVLSNISAIKSQEDIDRMLAELRESEAAFEARIQRVLWVTVSVEGSTVRVIPMENCRVTRVQFNVDADGNLKEGIWGKWESMREEPWDTKYSDFVWHNVADGVYTFVITQRDQNDNILWGLRTFTVSASSTKVAVTERYMREQIEKAEAIWNATPKATDAAEGEMCVPDAIHNHLKELIEETKELLNSSDKTFTTMVYKMFDLTAAERDFLASREEKKAISHNALISVQNGVILVEGKDLYACSCAKGEFNTEAEYKDAKVISCKLSGGAGTVQTSSNGTYTVCLVFKDAECEYKQIEVSDTLTATENEGNIMLTYQGNEDVIQTRYAYDDGSEKLSYRTYNGLKEELKALGNGMHIMKVKYADGEEDTLYINVASCTAPVVFVEDGQLTAYDYGYDIEVALYAKGHFASWEEMYQDVYNIDELNEPINTEEFEKGEYTFYFQDKDGKVYFEYVVIE